ncbi:MULTISPECIES: hypothetical protein [Enterococcus]|uniref:hypothetical protein n=1 Tax=Enterococcus TaxID=1350 RepID=UPI000936BBAE|nr:MULTISPECIES: hypothetical protein [Enterococcus]EGP4700538.1 hypothetical protein [Enterococcus faecium]EGP4705452.1 hypothetical protein [Enterococcus faecium]EGP4833798.1 hypothetical protein [Enterococcus faecium]EGP4977971.1 hypothetical protein [Enterococcus faecium]EGP5254179.1 hypothetical protein [Enterococcus faecium]
MYWRVYKMKIASEKIDQLTILVNQRIEDIIKEFEGEKIKNIKLALMDHKFELNSTKRKIVELIEEEIALQINEQQLAN